MDYGQLASEDSIKKTVAALTSHAFIPVTVATGKDALEYIKANIPAGASVMNGASITLEQIGYVDYLKEGTHPWNNLHEAVLKETDPTKKAELRRAAVNSDYYLGSVHAVTEQGELIIASNTGSQLPHLAFTSPNLILVVGTQKIVPDLMAALDRIEKHVVPLEGPHMDSIYGPGTGTAHNKTLILHAESKFTQRKAVVLLVGEKLGF